MRKALLAALLLLCAQTSWAALALDCNGSACPGVAGVGGTTTTLTLTTANTNDVIIVGAEYACSGGCTIASVASSHLTFTQRGTEPDVLDEWEAVASSALTSEVITITYSGGKSTLFTSATAFGISGANTSTVWDSHAGLPGLSTASADPTISTTNANDFIFGIFQNSSAATPTPGAGWTGIYNGAGGFFLAEYQIVSSAQTNLTVAVGTGTGTNKYSIVDAVIQAGGGGSCTHAGWTSGGAFTTPTASTTFVWLSSGAFGTTPCDGTGTSWWQSGGVFGKQ